MRSVHYFTQTDKTKKLTQLQDSCTTSFNARKRGLKGALLNFVTCTLQWEKQKDKKSLKIRKFFLEQNE